MQLSEAFERIIGAPGIGFRAFDGSYAGPQAGVPIVELRHPDALRYLVSARRFDVGLARAYVTGSLEVTGDLHTALAALGSAHPRLAWREVLAVLRHLGALRLLHRVRRPDGEAKLSGRRHSRARDAAAIAHHYDIGNDFYRQVLGASMTYTCAVFKRPGTSLDDAQAAKHDLIAGKLGLQAGMRLLDVGCGWGTMVRHAAKHCGVQALGVTLSREQAEWASRAIKADGLDHLAEVRHLDYRDLAETGFDAICSIEMVEHVGRAQLSHYFETLFRKLVPGGLLLNQSTTWPSGAHPELDRGGFIDRYIFPDGALYAPAELVAALSDTGFELCSTENLRKHAARTLGHWAQNLDMRGEEVKADSQTIRAWRLYLAGCRLAFERGRLQLHQLLAQKPSK